MLERIEVDRRHNESFKLILIQETQTEGVGKAEVARNYFNSVRVEWWKLSSNHLRIVIQKGGRDRPQ